MREYRGPIGAALLTGAIACGIAGVNQGASKEACWTDAVVLGFLIASLMFFVFAIGVFRMGPTKSEKPPRAAVEEFAEVILKDAGIWPSRWQRLRHPRTPVDGLYVRVPESVRQQNAYYMDALKRILAQITHSARLLATELGTDRHIGPVLDFSEWVARGDVLARDETEDVRALVEHAYNQALVRNANSQEVWENWDQALSKPALKDDERAQREEAHRALVAALEALQRVLDEAQP